MKAREGEKTIDHTRKNVGKQEEMQTPSRGR